MSDNLKPFICRFPYDGSEWNVEIHARDFDDAKRRLERIGTHGKVEGELMAKIPGMCAIANPDQRLASPLRRWARQVGILLLEAVLIGAVVGGHNREANAHVHVGIEPHGHLGFPHRLRVQSVSVSDARHIVVNGICVLIGQKAYGAEVQEIEPSLCDLARAYQPRNAPSTSPIGGLEGVNLRGSRLLHAMLLYPNISRPRLAGIGNLQIDVVPFGIIGGPVARLQFEVDVSPQLPLSGHLRASYEVAGGTPQKERVPSEKRGNRAQNEGEESRRVMDEPPISPWWGLAWGMLPIVLGGGAAMGLAWLSMRRMFSRNRQ